MTEWKFYEKKKIDPDSNLSRIDIKKKLKHEKNPMEILKLNRMLNNKQKGYGF